MGDFSAWNQRGFQVEGLRQNQALWDAGAGLTSDAVVALKDRVLGGVGVQVEQRFTGAAALGRHTVEVDEVGQAHQRQLLLGVRQHGMHRRLCRETTPTAKISKPSFVALSRSWVELKVNVRPFNI